MDDPRLSEPRSGETERGDDASAARDLEFRACLALRHCPGIGPKTWKRLLTHFGSAREACGRATDWTALRLVDARASAAFREGRHRQAARAEYEAARARGLRAVTLAEPVFPETLREIPDPPILLYHAGDISLLRSPAVALVGARQCSRYGFDAAMRLGRELSRAGVAVVSGLAHGIDRQAHLAGLSEVGGSIAVLGTGLDLVYPDTNLDIWKALATHGLILTEFAPGTHPLPANFPIRNRIISGLSLGVAVIEAATRSGSLITARLALEQGREVFALPGPVHLPTFEGCHRLIREGALLVQGGQDILEALAPRLAGYVRRDSGAGAETAEADGDAGRALCERPSPARRPLPPSLPPDRVPPKKTEAVAPAPPMPATTDMRSADPAAEGLTDLERLLLAAFRDGEKRHLDDLGRELGLASQMVSRALVQLELRGLVRKWPGMYYGLEREERQAPCRKSP